MSTITYAPETLVNVHTGEVLDYVVQTTRREDGTSYQRAFRGIELTKKGVPDQRCHGSLILFRSRSGYTSGNLARVDADREARGNLARAKIEELANALDAARLELENLYAPI